jgi:hypothetical protein
LGDGAGSCTSRARDASLRSSSLWSCRTSRRAHEASCTSCAGRGHGTSRAFAHRVQLPTWGIRASSGASGARDASEETPAWRATWKSLRAHEAACTSQVEERAEEAVVHYGPRTSRPGRRLGRTEDVIRHYGLWPPGLAGQLGGRGQLRRIRSPKSQLGELQHGGLQGLEASPRGVEHSVCRARSRYITGLGPSGSAADLGDQGQLRCIRSPKCKRGDSSLESDMDVAASP